MGSRILPILISFAGLFAAAGCATPARMPDSPPFSMAPTEEAGDVVAADGAAADRPATSPAEVGGATAVADQPSETLVAIADETELLRIRRPGMYPLPVRFSVPRADLTGRLAASGRRDSVPRRHVATLQFYRGSASLAREEYIILRAVAALRARQGGRIEVVGHADRGTAHGSAARRVNWLIAERRAAAVAAALVALGLPHDAIIAEGRGDTEALYAEDTAAGAAGNRRAEIYLLPSANPPMAAAPGVGEGPDADAPPGVGAVSADAATEQPAAVAQSDAEQGVVDTVAAVEDGNTGHAAPADAADPRRVPVATLYFPHASTRLGERERAIIEAVAVFQRRHPGEIVIVGHASAAGAAHDDPQHLNRANRSVSLARADTVAKRLAALGVAGECVSVVGKGADEPAFVESDAVGEAGNRRVEIYIDLPAAVRLAERE